MSEPSEYSACARTPNASISFCVSAHSCVYVYCAWFWPCSILLPTSSFEFYRTANPKNLSTVQSIVQSFKGDRRQLNEALVKKYRRSLLSRDEAARVMSSKVAAAPALKKTNPPASRGVVQKRPAPAPTSTTGAAARGGYGSTTFGAHGKPAAKKARVGATKQSSGSAGRGKGSASTASGNGKVTKAKAKSSAAAPGASGRKIKSLDRQSASARLEAILGAPPEPLLPMDELLKKLKKRSAVALKRELAARGCLSTGLKKDVVPRLAQVFFADAAANGARRGYAWWSEMEAELLDFFQRVDPVSFYFPFSCWMGTFPNCGPFACLRRLRTAPFSDDLSIVDFSFVVFPGSSAERAGERYRCTWRSC